MFLDGEGLCSACIITFSSTCTSALVPSSTPLPSGRRQYLFVLESARLGGSAIRKKSSITFLLFIAPKRPAPCARPNIPRPAIRTSKYPATIIAATGKRHAGRVCAAGLNFASLKAQDHFLRIPQRYDGHNERGNRADNDYRHPKKVEGVSKQERAASAASGG